MAKTKPIKQIDLHKQYLAQLPKQKKEKKTEFGVTEQATGGATPPMTYHGGPVQHSPALYIVLWGPNWSTDTATTAYLQNLISGLGAQPQDDWSTSMVQYTDSTGHPTFNGSVYQGTFQDTSTPPFGATQTQLGAEADAFYNTRGINDTTNTQIVVATQDGTCPSGFFSNYCPSGGSYCAWHSYTSSNGVPYTNLPYLAKSGGGCGDGWLNTPGLYDGVSIVEGHEYGETVTDPKLNAWYAQDSSGENGDLCAWTNVQNITFSSGTFAMQPLWSNTANACVQHTTIAGPYSLTVSKSGTGVGTVTSSPPGINCGTTCSASYVSGASVTLTQAPAAGSNFAGWGGACSGTAVTCTVSMTSARSVTATFTGSAGTRYEESAAALDGWTPYSDANGTYRASKVTGNTAQFTFSGTSVKWLTKKGPTMGKASVSIDGVAKGTFDLYASTAQSSTISFTGLASASHKMVIKVLGTRNASATDSKVAVDGFTVGTTTTQENAVKALYETWKGVSAAAASGGSYRSASAAGRTASLTFSGTGVDWITYTGPGWGQASVAIDGVARGTVDLYASTTHAQRVEAYSGLSAGSHTITIKVLGTKNAAANSTAVAVDAFVVHP